jgi:tRNA splicing endonuclease
VLVQTPNQTFSNTEMTRFVRLAQSLKAKALLAVVDGENNRSYFEVKRVQP